MKNKKRLKLESLEVESFKTDDFGTDMETIKGGHTVRHLTHIVYESLNGNPDCVFETVIWAAGSRLAGTPVCMIARSLIDWGEFLGHSFNTDCGLCPEPGETNINCNSHNPCFIGSNSNCLTFDVCGCP